MAHQIKTFIQPNSPERQWLETVPSALTRLMGAATAHGQVSPQLLASDIEQGRWQLSVEDIQCEGGSALLALLSCQKALLDADSHGGSPMSEDRQVLCLALARRGCDPFHCFSNGVDALDQAFGNAAVLLLDEWLPKVDWRGRRVDNLPWLHVASQAGSAPVLDALIRHGADIHELDVDGNTAMFYAADAQTVEWLRNQGVDRSHLNKAKVDALTYWQGTRALRGETLSSMESALGDVSLRKEEGAAISMFLESSKSAPRGRLDRDIKRLKIVGDELNGQQSIFSVALSRFSSVSRHPRQNQGVYNQANNWLSRVTQWPQAMSVATVEQLLDLFSIATVIEETGFREIAQAELNKRLPDDEVAVRCCARLGEEVQRRYGSHGGEVRDDVVLATLSGFKGFLDTQGEVVVKMLRSLTSQHHQAHVETFCSNALNESPQAAGWRAPGFVPTLLRYGTSYFNASKKCPHLFSLINQALENGAVWEQETEQVIAALTDKSANPDGVRAVLANRDRLALEQSTPLAGPSPGKPAFRL